MDNRNEISNMTNATLQEDIPDNIEIKQFVDNIAVEIKIKTATKVKRTVSITKLNFY